MAALGNYYRGTIRYVTTENLYEFRQFFFCRLNVSPFVKTLLRGSIDLSGARRMGIVLIRKHYGNRAIPSGRNSRLCSSESFTLMPTHLLTPEALNASKRICGFVCVLSAHNMPSTVLASGHRAVNRSGTEPLRVEDPVDKTDLMVCNQPTYFSTSLEEKNSVTLNSNEIL